MKEVNWHWHCLLKSYSQVFFSDNKVFAFILLLVSFFDLYTGLFGLISILMTNSLALWIGYDKYKIKQGYYGFNSLLVGLGLGIYFQPGPLLLFIVILAGILTLFTSIALEGIIGKYALPYLSIPFVLSLWAFMLASREFQLLGLNERGIYRQNELFTLGGHSLVKLYDWWNNKSIPPSLKAYFLSLGAILFQFNVLAGILIAIGLLIYSRIAFTLSLLGFYTAYFFYQILGARFTDVSYSYIGFNYILTAIAVGGYFVIANRSSYLWVILLTPLVAVTTISLSILLAPYQLPIYSLPFNLIALLFLYMLKFRIHNKANLSTLFVQYHSPEKNLYAFLNYKDRFGKDTLTPLYLPFYGEWIVTQGHNGEYTHKDNWRHALDFEMIDDEGNTFKNKGDFPEDYYCYNKPVLSPANGVVEEVLDAIPDNLIGEKNLEFNWGNTVVIKHSEYLYTKLSHLKAREIKVKQGDKVKKGDVLGKCGNSGNSPYPHLHFQVQATPYIGSQTIDYPITNYLVKIKNITDLRSIAVPDKGDLVSNIQVNGSLKKAFNFTPGEKLRWQTEKDGIPEEITWEVKIDFFLNRYLYCMYTKSKAYFKVDDTMLHFLQFEGDRSSLLYYFYLAAYKVSLGLIKDLAIKDAYPLHQVFAGRELIIQDFVAPFLRYLKTEYTMEYSAPDDIFSNGGLTLTSTALAMVHKKKVKEISFTIVVDKHGLRGFQVISDQRKLVAKCSEY